MTPGEGWSLRLWSRPLLPRNRHVLLAVVRGTTLGLAFAAMYVVGPFALRGFHVQIAWGLLGTFVMGIVVPRALQLRPLVPLLWLSADVVVLGMVGVYLRVPDPGMLPDIATGTLVAEASLPFLSGFLIAVLVAVTGRRVYAGGLGLLAGAMLLVLGEASVSHAPTSAIEGVLRNVDAPGQPSRKDDPSAGARRDDERTALVTAARSLATDSSGPPVSRDLYLFLRILLIGVAAFECGFITSRIDGDASRRRTAESLDRELLARDTIAKEMAAFTASCATVGSLAELCDALILHLRRNFRTSMRAVALEDSHGYVAVWEETGNLEAPLVAKRRVRLQEALREVGSNLRPDRLETRGLGGPGPNPRGGERLLTSIAVPVHATGRVAGLLYLADTRRETVGSDRIGAIAELARATGEALRRLERARDEQTRRTSILLGQMREGILLVGPEGAVVLHNPAGREMLRALGVAPSGPFHLGDLSASELATIPAGTVRRTNVSFTTADGRALRFAVTAMGAVDGGARLGTLVTLTDVTDEERGRRRLLHAEKMSFVGQTLASVAHELNNPLAAIVAYADLLAEAAVPPDVAQLLERIREQATRSSRIVKNLLSVARRRGPERTRASLNEIATSVAELFTYDARLSSVRIESILDPDLPSLSVDRHSIQQIIVNLVQNSLHSLRSRKQEGMIEIETSWSGSVARLVVRDDGPGVPAEARHRLFEAFFTTKGPDEGTGLGLAISRGIAREHGGDLVLEERSDGRPGAQFTLRLPLAEHESPTVDTGSTHVPEGVPACILVVDDEAAVRDSLVAQLSRLGAHVDGAPGIDEAYAHLGKTAYDVLLVDVRLHGRSGIEIHRDLREARSALADRIVFMTGDLVNDDVVKAVRATGRPLLEKPFTGEELRRALLATATM